MTRIQSLIFQRDHFTLTRAKNWCRRHGYKDVVDEKPKTYRFRQLEPRGDKEYRIIPIQTGIQAVLEI